MNYEITNLGKAQNPLLKKYEKDILEYVNDWRNQDDGLWDELINNPEYEVKEDDIHYIQMTNLAHKGQAFGFALIPKA